MKNQRRLQMKALRMVCFVLALGAAARAFADSGPPNLTPCVNNGWESLQTDLGFTFKNQDQCLIFTALGGSFGDFKGTNEVGLFITNLTGKNIQLRHIQYDYSAGVDNVTFGVPSQWPSGTLPDPAAVPNWPQNAALRLRFTYSSPVFGLAPDIKWVLHLTDLPDVKFNVTYRQEPGWNISRSTPFASCLWSGDGVHSALTPPLGR